MTIKRLQELKDMINQDYMTEDLYSGRDVISEDGEDLISLIDEKISQLSVTDEDVQEAIEWLNQIKANALNMLDWENDSDLLGGYKADIKVIETILQQMNKEPCEYCELEPTEKIYAYGMAFKKMPTNYCPNCGRKLR